MGGKRNTPKGTLLNAAAGIVAPPPGDPICAAYQDALDEWCRNKAATGKGGDFNDLIFKRVNDPALHASRELPIGVVGKGGEVFGFVTKGAAPGPLGDAGDYLAKAIANGAPLGSDGFSAGLFRLTGGSFVRKNLNGSFDVKRVLFPDAQRRPPGNAIEIKRPSEGPSHDGQLRNYAAASPNGQCEVINCQTCGSTCQEWGGADCPPKKAR
jgi:hypothetical protein